MLIGDDGLIKVTGVQGLYSFSNESTHLILNVVIQHLDHRNHHPLQLTFEIISIEALNQIDHTVNCQEHIAFTNKTIPLF